MANFIGHGALPYPIKGARFTIGVPYLDGTGTPVDPGTPDTERSIDGAAFADCTEETTTVSGSNGTGYITLTGDEMNGSIIFVAAKVTSGPKPTLAELTPRVLPIVRSNTCQANSASTTAIKLDASASAIDDAYTGCILKTTGGTGAGGGSGSLNNAARMIVDYDGTTKVATVSPALETGPDATTTFDILHTEFAWYKLADLQAWKGTVPNALQSGRVDSYIGALASGVIAAGSFASGALDAVWSTATRSLTAFSFAVDISAAAVSLIWDKATSGLTTSGSIGKRLVDYLTGDSFARLGAPAGASVSADIAAAKADTAAIVAKLPSGLIASQNEVLAISNNTHVRVIVPPVIERPDSVSTTYRLWLYIYDENGNMEAPDSLPTISAQNNVGTDRSSNLSAVTNPGTGQYYVDYTVAVAHALEALLFEWSIVEGGATKKHGAQSLVVDVTAVDFTSADRTMLQRLDTDYTTARAVKIDNLNATVTSRMASGATVDANLVSFAGSTQDVTRFSYWLQTVLYGIVQSSPSPTTTTLTIRTQLPNDQQPDLKGRSLTMSSSQACNRETRRVISSTPRSVDLIDLVLDRALSAAPASTDVVVLGAEDLYNLESYSTVWTQSTRLLTGGTNIVLAKGVGLTGLNDLSAAQVNTEADTALSDAGVTSARMAHLDVDVSSRMATFTYAAPLDAAATRAALGLASNNLDTQLAAIAGKTSLIPSDPADASDIAAAFASVISAIGSLNNISGAQVLSAMTQALRADVGAEVVAVPAADAPIGAQLQFLFQALRNASTETATESKIHTAAGVVVCTATLSDDGTTFTKSVYA